MGLSGAEEASLGSNANQFGSSAARAEGREDRGWRIENGKGKIALKKTVAEKRAWRVREEFMGGLVLLIFPIE